MLFFCHLPKKGQEKVLKKPLGKKYLKCLPLKLINGLGFLTIAIDIKFSKIFLAGSTVVRRLNEIVAFEIQPTKIFVLSSRRLGSAADIRIHHCVTVDIIMKVVLKDGK